MTKHERRITKEFRMMNEAFFDFARNDVRLVHHPPATPKHGEDGSLVIRHYV